MAIARDATSNSGGSFSTTSTTTWSHTCTGDDRLLVIQVASVSNNSVTSITYNGDSLTKSQRSYDGVTWAAETWYLVAPATGTNTVSMVMPGTTARWGTGLSYTGVDQTDPLENPEVSSGYTFSSSPYTASLTTINEDDWLVGFAVTQRTVNVASPATRHSVSPNTGACDFDSGSFASGSNSVDITQNSPIASAATMIAITPVQAAGATFIPRVMVY